MKKLFKKIWEFIKKILRIQAKEAAKAAEEAARQALEQEMEELSKQIETATGVELEYIQARIGFIHSLLLEETQQMFREAVEKLEERFNNDLKK